MDHHNKKNPPNNTQALANAETQLAIAAKKYKETGETHLGSLLLVCSTCTKLKATYKQTPKHERPEPTWIKYVARLKEREILTFGSGRMADLCIELDKGLQKVDLGKIKKLAPDGSYGAVRSAVNTLLGKPKPEKQEKTAVQCLARALKEIQEAEGLLPGVKQEISSIKTAIQKLIDGSKGAPADKSKPHVPAIPSEWLKKLTEANDALDQVASTKAMFKPKNVAEIAQNLGSKSALGRSVGKTSKHADYWAKVNKFPAELRTKLVKVFEDQHQTLDLSLIAPTK